MPKSPFEFLNEHILVSHETFERFQLYYELLLKWHDKINLIGKDTLSDIWNRHFLDSLQLAKYIDDTNKTIVDLGTGAGFPGMTLAIYGYKNVHLVESDSRKAVFLKEVSRVTGTEVFIRNSRIENFILDEVDVIISRACSPLDELLQLSEKIISRETICLFHKGKNYSIEHENAQKDWQYDMAVTPSIAGFQSFILKLSNVRKVRYHGQSRREQI